MSQVKGALFVCLGNLCRSPIAEAIFLHLIAERGISDQWKVDSAGLGGWHCGNLPNSRARATLAMHNVSYNNRARQIGLHDFDDFDYIFGMDQENISELRKKASAVQSKAQILLLGNFDPEGDSIIKNPSYDSDEDFEKVYQQCWRSCNAFLDKFEKGEV